MIKGNDETKDLYGKESADAMETKRVIIGDAAHPRDEELLEAAQILREGGLVAFPTETVYGLGGNGLDERSARKIYAAKGRPSDNPLILHIASMEALGPLVAEISEGARRMAARYWPGPLTMIFPKSKIVPYGTTGGLDTVAVRMPADPVARRLIALAGVPVAAPSANTSGRPSPTTADHVWQDMEGKIDLLVDGGPVGIGLESTIVDVSGQVPALLRPGAVTREMVEEVLGPTEVDPAVAGPIAEGTAPKAPGMKYKHYAPKGELTLIQLKEETVRELHRPGSPLYEQVRSEISAFWKESEKADVESFYMARIADREACRMEAAGAKVGVICTDETIAVYRTGLKRSIGKRSQADTVARNLYGVLREMDDLGVAYIYCESFAKDQIGFAVMNRLDKAAGHRILKV